MEITAEQEKVATENFYLRQGFPQNHAKAILTFFAEEVALFDKSLKPLYETSKQIENLRIDLHGHFYIPFETAVSLSSKLAPLRLKIASLKPVVAILQKKLRKSKNRPKEAIEFVREQQQDLKEFVDALKYADDHFPRYAEFLKRLFHGIMENVDQRTIITLDEYQMRAVGIRNQIYKTALASDHWALGFELNFAGRLSYAYSRSNARRKAAYDSLPKPLRAIVAEKDYTVFYPEPLGPEQVKAGIVFKKLFQDEAPQDFKALNKAINQHFDRRLEQILS